MRTHLRFLFIVGIMLIMCFPLSVVSAAEGEENAVNWGTGSSEVLPAQYTFVYGDGDKFQAHNWMKTGYVGGVLEFEEHYEAPHGISVWMEGHSLLDEGSSITRNDYLGLIEVEKKHFGFVKVEFKEFPKYYDTLGGVYHPFRLFSGTRLNRDLELDIGLLTVETGLAIEGWPEIEFEYEREFKDGAKSRLTWTNAVEGAITRKIGPSWQEIHETVHAFTIKAKHDIKEYTLKGEQHWEFSDSKNKRYEKNLGSTYAQKFYNIQTTTIESQYMSTMAGVEKWYLKEKAYSSLWYRFARLKNSEREDLGEFDESLRRMSFSSNAEQRVNVRGDNHLNSHTVVVNLTGLPWSWLALNTKIKSELLRARGNSMYPYDLADANGVTGSNEPPDGVIDHTVFSDNKNRTFRNGQSVSIRFKRIPRTALYTEFDIEETRNWLSENRWDVGQQTGPSANEIFNRRTVIDMIRGAGTVGGDFSPVRLVNSTVQFRYHYDNVTYDDKRESDPTTSAKSAFFDEMDTQTVEFNTRTTLRIARWLVPSFRYIVRDIDYMTRAEGEAQMESGVLLNDYIYDLTFMPLPEVIVTGSFARELLSTKTAANAFSRASIPLPGFDAGVNTWLFSMSYIPKENFSITGTVSQSRADNFDDYASTGIPLGADFNRVIATFGLKWTLKKDITVEPEYAYYHYGANPHADAGSYNAHLVGFEVSMAWG